MLRRKLLLVLGSLVALLVITGITAVLLLDDVLEDLDPTAVTVLDDSGGELSAGAAEERRAVIVRFRWIVFGLGLVFLVLVNASILVVFRTALMVLRPVDALVEASRHLAREEYEHRVEIKQQDEFAELGLAYNRLAEQLQENEQRKLETLQQVARTLNHELNNALSIINLQLELVARSSGGDEAQARRLEQIHEALRRMGETVAAVQHVRRIVLTDYVAGVKMLDLRKSVELETS